MTARVTSLCACLLATIALAGCSGDDDAAPTGGETVAATTTATPESVQTAVFERAYSECASTPLARLAAKYKAQRNRIAVSTAVAEAWRKQYDAGPDALEDGRAGCLQGFEDA